ncbi:MAG: hypothetical protein U0586_00025 [Candidatus Brocadiaceae bacterium]
MIKARECFGEIMNDGHINIPEGEKQLLNWKAGSKIRLIILGEEAAAGEDMLKKLQEKGLIKAPAKERIKPVNKRRLIHT